jgi:hypothetical protein
MHLNGDNTPNEESSAGFAYRAQATELRQSRRSAESSRRRLTNFSSGQIFDLDWSADGKRLLLCRGEVSSDVVLSMTAQGWNPRVPLYGAEARERDPVYTS